MKFEGQEADVFKETIWGYFVEKQQQNNSSLEQKTIKLSEY